MYDDENATQKNCFSLHHPCTENVPVKSSFITRKDFSEGCFLSYRFFAVEQVTRGYSMNQLGKALLRQRF